MKNLIIGLVLGGILVFSGIIAYQMVAKPKEMGNETAEASPTEKLIGGDKDEHGCLIGAGYSWCEAKQKCLRVWEEKCEEKTTEDLIKTAMALKHDKEESDVSITISQGTETHARGSVRFLPDVPGNAGIFWAAKVDGVWQIVADGNGIPDCKDLEAANFPEEMMEGICD